MGGNVMSVLMHKKTKIIFQSVAKNKTKYKTESGAIFPIHECEEWIEESPMLALEMPPKIGQVIMHGEHIFAALNLSRDRETQKGKVWHEWNPQTKTGQWYWYDDCQLVSDDLIAKWVEFIASTRHDHKEDTPEYHHFIQFVPQPIRDLCIVRSFNYILEKMAIGEGEEWF